MSAERIAEAQAIPVNFLENILLDLRRAGIVENRGGAAGGYLLAKPAGEIMLADVVRAFEGPLASVRGISPAALEYEGSAVPLREVWVALRSAVRSVLEHVTLADVASGELPPLVAELTSEPDAVGGGAPPGKGRPAHRLFRRRRDYRPLKLFAWRGRR